MKKFCLLLALMPLSWMYSQELAPFPTLGMSYGEVQLNDVHGFPDFDVSVFYLKDTFFCGQLHHYFVGKWSSFVKKDFFVRYEAGRVFINRGECGMERLLYDFSLEVGDTFSNFQYENIVVDSVSTFTLENGEIRKYIVFDNGIKWVDGIGDLLYGFRYEEQSAFGKYLLCVANHEGQLFSRTDSERCEELLCVKPFPIFENEGHNRLVHFFNHTHFANSYFWEFGDGNTSLEKNPSHIFEDGGCIEVCLTAYNGCTPNGVKQCYFIDVNQTPKWQKVNTPVHNGLIDCFFISENEGWLLSHYSVWKTEDGGLNWEIQSLPTFIEQSILLYSIQFLDENYGIISTTIGENEMGEKSGNVLLTKDGGETWTIAFPEATNALFDATLSNSQTAIGVGGNKTFYQYTYDGGVTWTEVPLPEGHKAYKIIALDEYTFLFCGHITGSATGIVGKTIDAGASWAIHSFEGHGALWGISFPTFSHGWVCEYDKIFKTIDGGETWSLQYHNAAINYFQDIFFTNNQEGWAVGTDGCILHTTDGGETWEQQNCGITRSLVELSFPSSQTGYGVNILDLYKYQNVSDTVQITETENYHLYPNPISDFGIVEFPNPENQIHYLKVYNSNGHLLQSYTTSSDSFILERRELENGLYFFNITNGVNSTKINGKFMIF